MYKCVQKRVDHLFKIYEEKCSPKYKIAVSNAVLHSSVYCKSPHKLYYTCSCSILHTFAFFFLESSMLIIDNITVISDGNQPISMGYLLTNAFFLVVNGSSKTFSNKDISLCDTLARQHIQDICKGLFSGETIARMTSQIL